MNDYWSQVQNLENNPQLKTSSSASNSDMKVIETDDMLPNVTATSGANIVPPVPPIDSGYLLPQKVKVRRYLLRK